MTVRCWEGIGIKISIVTSCYRLSVFFLFLIVVIVGLSSLVYQVTEGQHTVATVCATIQLGSVGRSREVAVNLTTQATGLGVISTGIIIFH